MLYRLRAVYHPARFQSSGRNDGWFEGWYFKLTDADGRHSVALIPGVSRDEAGGTSHAFVQVLRSGDAPRYVRYPFESFTFARDRFSISVGDNVFSAEGITLAIPEGDGCAMQGSVRFGPWTPWPVTVVSPGVMGWYRYVPRMECYHGTLSFDHAVDGTLMCGGEPWDFSAGRGYAEKDWGSSFPSSWIWAQSNHFGHEKPGRGPSVFLSVARIPWMRSSFTGHIAGLLLDGEIVRFATYTGSKIRAVETHPGGAHVIVGDSRTQMDITISGAQTGALKAPVRGVMVGRADESLDAQIAVELREIRGGRASVRFSGTGTRAGVEIMNERSELTPDR